jgi:hypothetical protein
MYHAARFAQFPDPPVRPRSSRARAAWIRRLARRERTA